MSASASRSKRIALAIVATLCFGAVGWRAARHFEVFGKPPSRGLQNAIAADDLVAAEEELKAGTNPNEHLYVSHLVRAVQTRDPRMVELLLRYGANPEELSMPPDDGSALTLAAAENDVPMMAFLLSRGVRQNDAALRGALEKAISECAPEAARDLVRRGAKLDAAWRASASGPTCEKCRDLASSLGFPTPCGP